MHSNEHNEAKALSTCRRKQLQGWLRSYGARKLPQLLALRVDCPSRQGLLLNMAVLASLALQARRHSGLCLQMTGRIS